MRRKKTERDEWLAPAYRESLEAIRQIAKKHDACLTCLSKAVVTGILHNIISANEFDHGNAEDVHGDMIAALVRGLETEGVIVPDEVSALAEMAVMGRA